MERHPIGMDGLRSSWHMEKGKDMRNFFRVRSKFQQTTRTYELAVLGSSNEDKKVKKIGDLN